MRVGQKRQKKSAFVSNEFFNLGFQDTYRSIGL